MEEKSDELNPVSNVLDPASELLIASRVLDAPASVVALGTSLVNESPKLIATVFNSNAIWLFAISRSLFLCDLQGL